MKKAAYISLAIQIIGILALYEGIIYAVYLFIYLVLFAINDGQFVNSTQYLLSNFLYTAFYSLIAWLALRKTGEVMSFLKLVPGEKESKFLDSATKDNNPIQKKELLYIVILGIGVYMLVPAAGDLAEQFIYYFQAKVDRFGEPRNESSLAIPFVKLAFPVVLLLLAKRISNNAFSL